VLELGERFLIAGTIPGLPFVAVGRTNELAWAPTYACMDAVDSWIEDCRQGRYRRLVDGQERWESFRTRTEVIQRKGKPTKTLVFYENDHGVLDGDPHQDGLYLATRWASSPATGAATLAAGFGMLTAGDVEAGMRTLGEAEIAQNWVLADRRGDIGYQMSGRLPIRRQGWSGLVPLPGWDSDNDWRGVAPTTELPRQRNPAAGFIATANTDLNHLGVRKPINLPMGVDRGARIAELLAERDGWTVADVQRMQMDVYSRHAARFMAVLEPLLPDGTQARRLLTRLTIQRP
jgi:penicillin G amidase